MNLISIDIQKKLMYIPVVNILNYIIWVVNLGRAKLSLAGAAKAFLYMVGHLVPLWFVFSAAGRFFPNTSWFFSLCLMYMGPMLVGYCSIKYQEKYLICSK